jgi:hypothetical protein
MRTIIEADKAWVYTQKVTGSSPVSPRIKLYIVTSYEKPSF